MVGSSNLGFDYFQIFKYNWIFEYIREYFLQIIFIFVTQGVKNNFHIRIRIICLLRMIFIFVFGHRKIIRYTLVQYSTSGNQWGERLDRQWRREDSASQVRLGMASRSKETTTVHLRKQSQKPGTCQQIFQKRSFFCPKGKKTRPKTKALRRT